MLPHTEQKELHVVYLRMQLPQVAYAGKISGFEVMAGLVGGPGGRSPPPRTQENFRKFRGKFSAENCKNGIYFGLFFKKK